MILTVTTAGQPDGEIMRTLTGYLAREPLFHFLVLGAALFALYAWAGARRGDTAVGGEIVVTAGRIRSLAETFSRQWSRPPSQDELTGLVRDFVREEVLAREAMAIGLDRDDTIVRRRLAQKMEFIADDTATVGEPTDDDLHAFLSTHPERFRVDARFTFDQILLDRMARGGTIEGDAAKLLAVLNEPGVAPDLAMLGDSRMLDAHFEDTSRRDVEARFGAGFVARLEELPIGRFEWPVESGYGPHLVRVRSRTPAHLPSLDEVRADVEREWSAAKGRERKEAHLQTLLSRYRVTIESAAHDTDRVAAVK